MLVQIPPAEGVIFVVPPIHISEGPFKLVTGSATTVNGSEGSETQLVLLSVKIKVVEPLAIPVTNPLLSILAI